MSSFSSSALSGGKYLVTGASSGIGRAVAVAISNAGGELLLAGRDEGRLHETESLLSSSAKHYISPIDFLDADQTESWLLALIQKYGPLSGVFHGSGIELIRPARMTKQIHINEILRSSLFAGFGLARGLSQKNSMQDSGSIIFMSSVASITGQSGMTAYSAAKAGVNGLVRSLACELAPRKIRVNAISSGAVLTEMHHRLIRQSGPNAATEYERAHLLGIGAAEDVAEASIFLLSNSSKWITGSNLIVDGGYSVR